MSKLMPYNFGADVLVIKNILAVNNTGKLDEDGTPLDRGLNRQTIQNLEVLHNKMSEVYELMKDTSLLLNGKLTENEFNENFENLISSTSIN